MFLLCDEQSRWLNEIQKSDWGAGQYLYELLRDHRLKDDSVGWLRVYFSRIQGQSVYGKIVGLC